MGSETLPSACYILSEESIIPFYSTSNGYKYRVINMMRKYTSNSSYTYLWMLPKRAAVYKRATYKNRHTSVRLLCAKSKVDPLAKQSEFSDKVKEISDLKQNP